MLKTLDSSDPLSQAFTSWLVNRWNSPEFLKEAEERSARNPFIQTSEENGKKPETDLKVRILPDNHPLLSMSLRSSGREVVVEQKKEEYPRFLHEVFGEFNIGLQSQPGFRSRVQGTAQGLIRIEADEPVLHGSAPKYSNGYDSIEEFKEHIERLNTPRPVIALSTVISKNLEINYNLRIGDGICRSASYLTKKAKTWDDINAIVEEFFDVMGFDKSTICTSVDGNTVSFTSTYYDVKCLPIGNASISFTKENAEEYIVVASAAVMCHRDDHSPNVVKHAMDDWLSIFGQIAPASVVFRKIYWEYNRPSYRSIKSSRLGDPAFDEFYPWITCGVKNYIDGYLDSPASVLLLIGMPGTGKSTLIRSLRTAGKARMYMCDAEALAREADPFEKISQLFAAEEYEEPEIGTYFDGRPKQIKYDTNILIIEDADDIIHSRKDGNKNMARLLSLTNGLDNSEKVKVVISTNLDAIDKVDTALLRPGRCYDILSFRPLTPEEANKARAVIGKEPRDFGKLKAIPLAVALSDDQTSEGTIVAPRYSI